MTVSYASQSSSSAPIRLRRRPDIVVKEVVYQGETFWVCKDPLDQQFHRLNEQEYAIFCWLDGNVSFDDLREKFERKFTPYRVELRELAQVLGQFHEKSLVNATDASQGEKLLEMGRDKLRKELKQKAMSAHAIKWKGFDPEVFLNATNPYVTWFFSAKAITVVLTMTCIAAGWLAIHYEQLMAKAPSLWSMVDSANWATLFLVIAGTKLLHEFGHAYSFKRFGGEVHEIGVMIFFFMPTMYCNTSDSWMLPNKWERIAVALGGVYVEITIFTIASFVWWFSGPGMTRDIAINLMFVCSLSTVVVNGNPLLKYDGYFVLSDLFEIPNLSEDSSDQIRRWFMVNGLGLEDEATPWLSSFNRWFMLIYGVAAYLFKLSLMLTISYFLVSSSGPYGLAPIGFLFAGVITLVYLGMPLYKLGKKLVIPGTMIKIKKPNMRISIAIVLAILIMLFVPFPYYIKTDCTLDGGAAGMVVTQVPGELKHAFFKPGDRVNQGDVIVELNNPQLERQMMAIHRQMSMVEVEIESSKHNLFTSNGSDTASINFLKEKLAGLTAQHVQLAKKKDALILRAPMPGRIVGIRSEANDARMNDARSLKMDHGNLLVGRVSTWLAPGVEVCRIRSDGNAWATLTIKQADQDIVSAGQRVLMLFNSDRSQTFESVVESLSHETEFLQDLLDFETEGATIKTMAQASATLKQGAPVNSDGASMDSSVQLAQCKIEGTEGIPFGSNGVAKIYLGRRSMFWRFTRAYRLFVNTKL